MHFQICFVLFLFFLFTTAFCLFLCGCRLKASLLEHFNSNNHVNLSTCFEDALKKDPTCSYSLTRLLSMHQNGMIEFSNPSFHTLSESETMSHNFLCFASMYIEASTIVSCKEMHTYTRLIPIYGH